MNSFDKNKNYNNYYSCLGGLLGGLGLGGVEKTDMFVDIDPSAIPADMYALWFLPSWGTTMSNDPRYQQWGKMNNPTPRRLQVKRRT